MSTASNPLAEKMVHDLRSPLVLAHSKVRIINNNLPALLQAYHFAKQHQMENLPELDQRDLTVLQAAPAVALTSLERIDNYLNEAAEMLHPAK